MLTGVEQQHHQPADESLGPTEALYLLMVAVVGRVPRDMSLTQLSTLSTLADGGPRRITDLAAIYRMPTARTPVGPIVDVDAVHEVGRKAGHEAGHAEGYEAGRKAGYEAGRTDCYEAGYKKGYDEGFQMGLEAKTPPEPEPPPPKSES